MTVRDFARRVVVEFADPYGRQRHARQVEQELAEARAKLAELAHVHCRYDLGGRSYCADHDGHNEWVPYPCAVRLCVDGAGAS